MKLKDLVLTCSNVRLEDYVKINYLVSDIATDELENVEDRLYTVLYILSDYELSNIEVTYFELIDNKLIVTCNVYKHFN